MAKRRYTEYTDLPENIRHIYLEEREARWKHRELSLTTDTPFLDGFVTAVAAACFATPFLNYHGESVESSGPIVGIFWVGGWLVSKFRHSEWSKNYKIEESIELSAFIQRADNGDFDHLQEPPSAK